jgi:uncharacterized SAM-binding protein YcdF (DUF218 family)
MTRGRWSKLLSWFAAILVLSMAVIFCTPLVKWTAGALAVDWYEGDGDVLVVLGGSMLVPGTGPRATLGYDSYLRSMYAGWMLKSFRFPLVVVSGGEGLAESMANVLRAQGVPAEDILIENRSRSTWQNAAYVKALLQQHSIALNNSRIVIVTSDFHCWRARAAFAKSGVPIRVMPVPDVVKRCGYAPYRLEGFVTVAQELMKDLALSLGRPMDYANRPATKLSKRS